LLALTHKKGASFALLDVKCVREVAVLSEWLSQSVPRVVGVLCTTFTLNALP